MIKWILLGGLVGLLPASLGMTSHQHQLCEGAIAKNSAWIEATAIAENGFTEEMFDAILDRLDEVYRPIIEEMGNEFIIHRDWEDGTVNAFARQEGNRFIISMFGGWARHEENTAPGFITVACHEVGHHLGGAPRKGQNSHWPSTEGQSDYYAQLKCMRKVLDGASESQLEAMGMDDFEIDEEVIDACDGVFSYSNEQEFCYAGAMGGKSFARLNWSFTGDSEPNYETPDERIVDKTSDFHPASQCRFDTFFNGALCDVDPDVETDFDDDQMGVCNRFEGDEVGVRPLCWFKPQEES